MMRKLLAFITKAVSVLVALALVGVAGLFCYGLFLFPAIRPPQCETPQTFSRALWAEVGGMRPIPETSMGMGLIFKELFSEIFAVYNDRIPLGDPVLTLASFVAKDAIMQKSSDTKMRISHWHLIVFCGSTWVAYQWTPSQMLAHLSETVYLGHGFHGINSASQGYFGLPVQDLTFSQTALLVAIWKNPRHFDPWCAPERAVNRVNDFITKRNLRIQPVISIEELGVKPAPSNACESLSR